MATARDYLNGSFSYNLNRASETALTTDEIADGLTVLNAYCAALEVKGVSLNFTYINDVDDIMTTPEGSKLGLIQNIALQVAPMFGGAVSADLATIARGTYLDMVQAYSRKPVSSFPSTLSRGSGNDWDTSDLTNPYYPKAVIPAATIKMQGNTTDTVIAAVDTPTLILGSWVELQARGLTVDAAGRITNSTDVTLELEITANFTATVTAKDVNIYVYRSGVQIPLSKTSVTVATTLSIPYFYKITLEKAQYFEFYCENATDGVDILFNNALVQVK